MGRIDVHHHFFPADIDKEASNKKVGWRAAPGTIPWNPDVSIDAMNASDIEFSVLSLPAIYTGSVSQENRAMTRERNVYASQIVRAHPDRFGFFASLPFLDDVEGALAEIAYALDVLKADGIALSSSYGVGGSATYVGDDRYDAIWAELHHRASVVFLHGAQIPSSTPMPHPFLCLPISEVPNETFKAAAHLVVTGRKRKYPNVKIILAHMGGSTMILAPRVAVLSNHMGCTLTPQEMIDDFKDFYYDTALSAHGANLTALDAFVEPSHILFGSDFPAVSMGMADWYSNHLQEHYASNKAQLERVMFGNALALFPRLRDVKSKQL